MSEERYRELRSIPAGAGEPHRQASGGARGLVYPRGCGGTALVETDLCRDGGLSPRVRGNLEHPRITVHLRRSIPAGAGEPGGRANAPTL